jgi:hypothetical protein
VRISKTDDGYRLDARPDCVDVYRFDAKNALEEWRGEPLNGLSGDWAAWVREGLHRKRIGLLAGWADAALAGGRAG